MFKFTSLVLGLLTVISVAPKSQAMTGNVPTHVSGKIAARRGYSERRREHREGERREGERRETERRETERRETEDCQRLERERRRHHKIYRDR